MPALLGDEFLERDLDARKRHDLERHLEARALAVSLFQREPHGLTNAGTLRRVARGHVPVRLAPLPELLSNHGARDSVHWPIAQGRSCSPIAFPFRLPGVGKASRRIPEHMAVRIRDLLKARLDADFGEKKADGSRRVGQRQICELIGLSQPVLQDIESGSGSLGVHALIALRNYLETPIDALLDLPALPPKKQPPATPEAILAGLEAVTEALRRQVEAPTATEPPPPPPRKKGTSDAPRPRRR